jgi:hypothetical protein
MMKFYFCSKCHKHGAPFCALAQEKGNPKGCPGNDENPSLNPKQDWEETDQETFLVIISSGPWARG